MQIIATVPFPLQQDTIRRIASHPYVDALRFNTGARSDVPPLQTLVKLLNLVDSKPLWIDLKGRQLRIDKWADLKFDPIRLNHRVSVDLPANVILRNGINEGFKLPITAVKGREVYVDIGQSTRFIVGRSQAVNIHGDNLKIEGYFTDTDTAYIDAARKLGIHNYMLSFVERKSDITNLLARDPEANIVLKIESPKGLSFIERLDLGNYDDIHLMAARDDLYVNLPDPLDVIDATRRIVELDRDAILASRVLTSLIKSQNPSLGDISDLMLAIKAGYKRIMLCDDLCSSEGFYDAMNYLIRME